MAKKPTEPTKTIEELEKELELINLVEAADYKEALSKAQLFIEEHPKNSYGFLTAGRVKDRTEEFESSIEYYDKAIALDPENEEALWERGTTKKQLGRHKDAIKDFDRAIELDSELAVAYFFRAGSKDALGLFDESLKDYAKAAELKPTDETFNMQHAIALGKKIARETEGKLVASYKKQLDAYQNPQQIIKFYEDEIKRTRHRLYGVAKDPDDELSVRHKIHIPILSWLNWFMSHRFYRPLISLIILWIITVLLYFCLPRDNSCQSFIYSFCKDIVFFVPSILLSFPLLFWIYQNFKTRKEPKETKKEAPPLWRKTLGQDEATRRAYSQYRYFVITIWAVLASVFYSFHLNAEENAGIELSLNILVIFTTSLAFVTLPFHIYARFLSKRAEEDKVHYFSLQRDYYRFLFWNAQPTELKESNRSQLAPEYLSQMNTNSVAEISLRMLERPFFQRRRKSDDVLDKLDELTTAIKNLTPPKAE